jgi:small subunit ribosomal protein S4
MRKISSQCKLCRREGEKLFLKGERCNSPKCAMVKKNYQPGFHGPKKRMKKASAYGQQLREKQKTKRIYGMLEKPFKNLVSKAMKGREEASLAILRTLESRFDNIVYRSKLADSRNSAKQLISHGHFKINGKNVDISSYGVKTGDKITVKENKAKDAYWDKVNKSAGKRKDIPTWLNLDNKKLEITVAGAPDIVDLQKTIDMSLIIEFYSR